MTFDWLARRAQLSPHHTALIDGDQHERAIDYATLNHRAHLTATTLIRHGLAEGDRVAVLAENCVAYLELLFACQKLGLALVNLNWRLAPPELEQLLDHARPRLLVHDDTHTALATSLARGLPKTSLDSLADARLDGRLDSLPTPSASNPAWVICYTGGSTGTPRGVVLTQRSMTANAVQTATSWGLTAKDTALLDAPLFHTGGLNVLTTPLIWVGGTSIIARRFDPKVTLALSPRLTVLFGVPTMFARLIADPDFERADLSRLRLAISGGAPTPAAIFTAMHNRGVPFRAGFGLTEAGPNNFWLPDDQLHSKVGSVGYPLMGIESRLVDGELELRGDHVMAGYFMAPDKTAEVLSPDGWLKTGDLAAIDADGAYTIIGRKKDLFISGGENVYPPEVESAITAHPSVSECAVLGRPDPHWGETGHAFVALHPGHDHLDAHALVTFLESRLARYKIPRHFVFGPLPLTGAGKIDRLALRVGLATS